MAKHPKPKRVSERLREAVQASQLTRYRISQLSGIDQATLSRFANGSGLNLESIDRLSEVLGLELVPRKATNQQKGTR